MKPNIGIPEKGREGSVRILNEVLSDEYVLYTKTRNFHWNVTGPDFSELHKFFEAQYEEIDGIIDEVAERARTLGGRSLGTLDEFLKATQLEESTERPDQKGMIGALLRDHETIVRKLRADLETCAQKHGDMGTSDFLTGVMERHEKMAWMLRAYVS